MKKTVLQIVLVLLVSSIVKGCFYDPFEGINATNVLKFSGLSFEHLPKSFVTAATAKFVILSNNGIKTIADGAFSEIPRLKTLDLSNNNLVPKNFFSFGNHGNLEAIILDNNLNKNASSEDLEITISTSYPKLKYVSLRNVGLKTISSNLSTYLNSLSYLDFSYNNGIDHETVLARIPNTVQSICLEGTGLRNISVVLQNSLRNIRNISVSNNDIGDVTFIKANGKCNSSLCLRLPNVRIFNAANCNVSSFVVEERSTLEKLDLSSNNVIEIKNSTAVYLTFLTNLNVSYNPLSKMLGMALLPRLRVLAMDGVDPEMARVFVNSNYYTNVNNLSLSGNKLTGIPTRFTTNVRNLMEINLSNNLLTALNLNQNVLSAFTLKRINLSNNNIKDFKDVIVSRHRGLELLDVRGNPITNFTVSSLSGLQGSTKILLNPACNLKL